ncbi:YhgE/Pip domain-containing protein [Laedolimicola ammoniilytica]|uniref:YhgE/Pip domain-containing protein n=1 Tax=Laedolimicola ammoniilytica TaxID=2981771 RepID=A0ABT2RVQ7_9FIRM|nr:YhgE/Pip domain-containing protein [Laedolimicola ammoniilytica]MCU6696386.1 YhgE/Pip domain-containing protein [Laedolimicola ammoniilytica]SCH61983.1 YhgE/Pip C-terminal domain [uncultured Clostridium sp.]
MKNILQIFLRDIRKIKGNTIAMIMMIGILVVPTLYAWFNIGGSWDPYENTSGIKIAVASDDAGYQGDLLAIDINLGDKILTYFHENDEMDWVFTDSEEAIEGAKSGKYYAAIVVPESFSEDMMTLFSTGKDLKNPELQYYANGKKNAIASIVTEKRADAVQGEVSEKFVKAISKAALEAMKTVVNVADEADQSDIVDNLIHNLEDISSDLTAAAGTISAFESMASATQTMLDSTSTFLKDTQTRSDGDLDSLGELEGTVNELKYSLDGATSRLNDALESSAALYQEMAKAVRQGIQAAATSDDVAQLKTSLGDISTKLDTVITGYSSAADQLDAANASLAQQGLDVGLGDVIADLRTTVTLMQTLKTGLGDAMTSVGTLTTDAAAAQKELDGILAKLADNAASVQKDYEDHVKKDLQDLASSVGNADAKVTTLLDSMDEGLDGVYKLSDSTESDLAKLQKTLKTSRGLLERGAADLTDLADRLRSEKDRDSLDTMDSLLDEDLDVVGSFISTPVELTTEHVYEVENYGSAMAPFYTTLAIWVGGVVMAAMLKAGVKEKELIGLTNVKNYQKYLGRYLLFLILGLLQATLICLGDLYFLGIQCKSPLLFLLAGWVTSLVYVNLIYTLCVSFGDIGKAVSVILMVLQVAGTGGNFPIELAPAFFQKLYNALPFVYSMNAMRETVAGFYGNYYWNQLGTLLLYLIPSLVLGLILRMPIIRWNEHFEEKLESTKLF